MDKDLISLCMEDAAGSTLPACEILLNVDGSNRGAALATATELCLHLPVKEETVGFQEEWVVHEVWWGPKVPPPAAPSTGSATTPLGPLPLPPPGAPPPLVHHPMHHPPVAMGGGAAAWAAAPFVLPLPPPRPEAAAAPVAQHGPAMPAAAMAAASMAAAAAAEVAAGLASKGVYMRLFVWLALGNTCEVGSVGGREASSHRRSCLTLFPPSLCPYFVIMQGPSVPMCGASTTIRSSTSPSRGRAAGSRLTYHQQ